MSLADKINPSTPRPSGRGMLRVDTERRLNPPINGRVWRGRSIKNFPRTPGVYLFKGAKGDVLYVGKAKNLRLRIKSYFSKSSDERPQIEFLLRRARDLDFIVTETEKEALLLENTLIKEHRPRYNISLRDDKSYVSIRIGAEHQFPAISLTRRIKKDGARYYGPYDSGLAAREALAVIQRHFHVRTCSDTEFANRVRPCLKFDIGLCAAPCAGRISKNEYAGEVKSAEMFLRGQSRKLAGILSAKMREASGALEYEEAGRLRDAIGMLRGVAERQNVVLHGGGDSDAVGAVRAGERIAICVLKVRGGALKAKKVFHISDSPSDLSKIIEEFLLGFYREAANIPPRIVLSHRPESLSAIEDILSERKGVKVNLIVPSRGAALHLVQLALTNAREAANERAAKGDDRKIFENLGRKLRLGQAPSIIECLDISNLNGREAVGSLVAFVDGSPDKTKYRIYNIRTLSTPDDYGMMTEVITRRFSPEFGKGRGDKFDRPLPDLLLVDGGKGQLAVVCRALKDAGISFPVAAIAKGEKKGCALSPSKGHADQIFIPGRKNPLNFKRGSKELLFLMKIRDEAHRFGIQAHRKRRSKKLIA